MWPFDDPDHQIPHMPPPPAPMHQGMDPRDLKIFELEQRMFGLEQAIITLSKVINQTANVTNENFAGMHNQILKLIQYVMLPRTQIMGEQQDKN